MKKSTLKITLLFILFILIITYGWSLFQRLNYNKKVFETDIYTHVPQDARSVISFSRNYHFDEYFEVDSINASLLNPIKDDITYPVLIIRTNIGDDLLIMRATKEQKSNIFEIFNHIIAPFHHPKMKRYNDANLYFYSLSDNNFIITTFTNGLFIVSTDYQQIERFLDEKSSINILNKNTAQFNHYIEKTYKTSPISIFTESDSTVFALSYVNKNDTVILDGEYFGKLQDDSLKLSYNEINRLFRLETHYTDSVQWDVSNKLKIWINKLENEMFTVK